MDISQGTGLVRNVREFTAIVTIKMLFARSPKQIKIAVAVIIEKRCRVAELKANLTVKLIKARHQ